MYNSFRNVLIIVIITAYLSLYSELGFALDIEINPNKVNGLVHDDVTIVCKLDNNLDSDVREIVLLELTKGDAVIAIIRQNLELSIEKGMDSKYQAVGNITKSVLDSYIRVTLANPDVDDSGQYSCRMYYLDFSSNLQETGESANLTVSDQDMESVLKYLVGKVSSLESDYSAQISRLKATYNATVDGLSTELDKVKNVYSTKIDQLEREVAKQEVVHTAKIDLLEKELLKQKKAAVVKSTTLEDRVRELERHLKQSLKDVTDRENTTVLFTALHPGSGVFQKGEVMIYSEVVDNIGDAYNGSTGVFRAPVNGFYFFDLSVASSAKGDNCISIDLVTSKGRVLARILDSGADNFGYTDTNCITRLLAGERVYPVIQNVKDFSLDRADSKSVTGPVTNKFYGYLLKALQ